MTAQEIVDKLVAIRKRRGYTQIEMANLLGISQVQYGKYENGNSDLSLTKFLDLLKILEVDIADFSDQTQQNKNELLTFLEKQEIAIKQLKDKLKG